MSINKQYEIEANTLMSIFHSNQRIDNYLRWDMEKAQTIVERLFNRGMMIDDLYPELANALELSSSASALTDTCFHLNDDAADLYFHIDDFENNQIKNKYHTIAELLRTPRVQLVGLVNKYFNI